MIAMLSLAFLASAAVDGSAARGPAPTAQCLDARSIQSVWPQAPDRLLVQSAKGFHRVQLAADCLSDGAQGRLLARDGWVCGQAGEYLQTAAQQCAVSGVERLSETQFARAVRAHRPGKQESSLQQAFHGSSSHCIDPTRVRGWSVSGNELIVSTARASPDGPNKYRVRLSGSCPESASRDTLNWRSLTGFGRICGVPGEFAVFTSQHNEVVKVARAFLSGPPTSAELRGCPIEAVEAVDA